MKIELTKQEIEMLLWTSPDSINAITEDDLEYLRYYTNIPNIEYTAILKSVREKLHEALVTIEENNEE